MLEAGGCFGFAAESLHMRFCGPMSQTDDLKSYRAVQTFLPRAIYNSLAAAADFLQQFVVAKIGECLCRTGCPFSMRRSIRIIVCCIRHRCCRSAGVIAPGYR